MEYEEYFDARNSRIAKMEFRVFSSVHPTNADMESEAFLADYLEKYYLI